MPLLSIVIPVFNQTKNLPKLFEAFDAYCNEQNPFRVELVLVDDGSTDPSVDMMRNFARSRAEAVSVIGYTKNRGRGHAVRVGLAAARGRWCVVTDPDLAASFREIKNAYNLMEEGCDLVVGSRRLSGSVVETPPSLLRYTLGMGYIYLARAVTGVNVSDFSCGFKAYSRRAIQSLLPYLRIERWAHDAEALYLAKKKRLMIGEIPLHWSNGTETKVKVLRDVVVTLGELARIRLIHG